MKNKGPVTTIVYYAAWHTNFQGIPHMIVNLMWLFLYPDVTVVPVYVMHSCGRLPHLWMLLSIKNCCQLHSPLAYPCFWFHAKFGICKHTFSFLQDLGIVVGISSCKLWKAADFFGQWHDRFMHSWSSDVCSTPGDFLHFNTSTFLILVKPALNQEYLCYTYGENCAALLKFFANQMTHNCKFTIIWTASVVVLIIAERHVLRVCTRRCMCVCEWVCLRESLWVNEHNKSHIHIFILVKVVYILKRDPYFLMTLYILYNLDVYII